VAKSDDRRAAILDRLADHVLAEGLAASSLRPLAQAAGLSDRMLLYYFRDKAEVMAATLDVIAGRFVIVLNEAAGAPRPLARLMADLPVTLLADAVWPYMCLWLDVASLSARGEPFYRAVGERIGRGFLDWAAAQLDSATPEARARDAATLLVTMEGMVLLKSLGMEDVARRAVPL